jgi:hypothetical protein
MTGRIVAAQQPASAPRTTPIRIFLDCGFFCDEDFLKREITFVDYMRDRRDADVHVLVTTQETGGGGTEYTLKFIGLGSFAGATSSTSESRTPSDRSSTTSSIRVSAAEGISFSSTNESRLIRLRAQRFDDSRIGDSRISDAGSVISD